MEAKHGISTVKVVIAIIILLIIAFPVTCTIFWFKCYRVDKCPKCAKVGINPTKKRIRQ